MGNTVYFVVTASHYFTIEDYKKFITKSRDEKAHILRWGESRIVTKIYDDPHIAIDSFDRAERTSRKDSIEYPMEIRWPEYTLTKVQCRAIYLEKGNTSDLSKRQLLDHEISGVLEANQLKELDEFQKWQEAGPRV